MNTIHSRLATRLNIGETQIAAAVKLLDEGQTVPFIARYRKEVTNNLDDTQLRDLQEQLIYLRELDARRDTILKSIEEQDKLTNALKESLLAADTKARLEDLYLPYKPKRRTKAQIAIEAGLEPLADTLLADPTQTPESLAKAYLNDPITNVDDALSGALHILIERFAENADLLAELREMAWRTGSLHASVVKNKETEAAKFKDYFDYSEPLKKVPSHRLLAIARGSKLGLLRSSIQADDELALKKIAKTVGINNQNRPADLWLQKVLAWSWKVKIKLKIDLDIMLALREQAENEAIHVFQENLKNLLMASPAGKKVTLGLDPGLRTGVKTVVVDDMGTLLEYCVIYPHAPQKRWDESLHTLEKLCDKYQVDLISIGNGTASRETEKLAKELLKQRPKITSIVVSEAGASVYSASALAAKEFPSLDVSYRGAVSIARRLQDPLAELVKIDPKAIGVGQYQHDVNQTKLARSLDAALEDCVNAVGADVNTASVPLLKSIAGLNETIAQNIIQHREANGRFTSRRQLKEVPRLGEKTYEQAVGFLRIIGGSNPLDASAVHPESYTVVDKMAGHCQLAVNDLIGNTQVIQGLRANEFITDVQGLATINDIFAELQKPGRDPRPEFKTAQFKDGVETLNDLKAGMKLEGVITNVTNFGAFVDIGVHQDGLVHISHLADRFVDDPKKIVKAGEIVHVTVLDIDIQRKRISLSMKSDHNNPRKKAAIKKKPVTQRGSFGHLLAEKFK